MGSEKLIKLKNLRRILLKKLLLANTIYEPMSKLKKVK